MKAKVILAAVLSGIALSAAAQVHVSGYTKKDGTYVAPHQRSAPNNTAADNYSTKGNINPYTGKAGTKELESSPYGYHSPQRAPEPSSNLGYPSTQQAPRPAQQDSNPFGQPAARF